MRTNCVLSILVEYIIEVLHLEVGDPELFVLVDLLDLAGLYFFERPQSLHLVDLNPLSADWQIETDAHLVDELAAKVCIWQHVLRVLRHLIVQLVGL